MYKLKKNTMIEALSARIDGMFLPLPLCASVAALVPAECELTPMQFHAGELTLAKMNDASGDSSTHR